MANLKRNTLNVTVAILAVLFVVGMFNVGAIIDLVTYANAHLGSPMGIVFSVFFFLTFFLLPIIGGSAVENWMYESNTRVGSFVSNAVCNARDSFVSLVALGLAGGTVTFFCVWGAATIICAA